MVPSGPGIQGGDPMKFTMIVAAALALAAGAGPALAQQPTPEQAIAFLDKDNDGKCNLNEYLTFQVSRIAQLDTNADGALQYGEFKESLQGKGKQNAQRSFDAFNTEDNRSALTQREFLGYHAYVFKTFVDTDKDGFMTAEEWSKLMGLN
jgi:hypothetical protein